MNNLRPAGLLGNGQSLSANVQNQLGNANQIQPVLGGTNNTTSFVLHGVSSSTMPNESGQTVL